MGRAGRALRVRLRSGGRKLAFCGAPRRPREASIIHSQHTNTSDFHALFTSYQRQSINMRGSYDPMNCTASCFVVGPHLMMVSETFPLHLFPLGLTTTEKDKGPTGAFTGPRDSSPGTPCVPQLGARRAYPHAPARSRGFPPARERCRPPGAARRSRDSYASRKPSSAVTVRNVSTLFPYARYSTVVKLAYG